MMGCPSWHQPAEDLRKDAGIYIVDVWTETEDIFIFAGVLIAPMRLG